MENPSGVKQLIQSMIPDSASIIEGIVNSANPLSITLVNDAKIELGGDSLVVPQHLTDYSVRVNFEGAADGNVSSGDHITSIRYSGIINFRNALKNGEKVYLLQINCGRKYFVLDRKG